MGRLGLVGMGWLVEGVFTAGLITLSAPNSWSACLNAGATPTTSHNRAIRWVGDNHGASLVNRFLFGFSLPS